VPVPIPHRSQEETHSRISRCHPDESPESTSAKTKRTHWHTTILQNEQVVLFLTFDFIALFVLYSIFMFSLHFLLLTISVCVAVAQTTAN
jgi:hypothetical protein